MHAKACKKVRLADGQTKSAYCEVPSRTRVRLRAGERTCGLICSLREAASRVAKAANSSYECFSLKETARSLSRGGAAGGLACARSDCRTNPILQAFFPALGCSC